MYVMLAQEHYDIYYFLRLKHTRSLDILFFKTIKMEVSQEKISQLFRLSKGFTLCINDGEVVVIDDVKAHVWHDKGEIEETEIAYGLGV